MYVGMDGSSRIVIGLPNKKYTHGIITLPGPSTHSTNSTHHHQESIELRIAISFTHISATSKQTNNNGPYNTSCPCPGEVQFPSELDPVRNHQLKRAKNSHIAVVVNQFLLKKISRFSASSVEPEHHPIPANSTIANRNYNLQK